MSTLTSPKSAVTENAKTAPFDNTRHEAFGDRVVGMLNEASLTFMLSIGHRTGLLDTLKRLNRLATTYEIADEAGLDERYVREWLGALVTGGVVDYDADTRSYHLPPEHAAWLTREATPNNLAGVMQFMSMFDVSGDHDEAQIEPNATDNNHCAEKQPHVSLRSHHDAEPVAEFHCQIVLERLAWARGTPN